MLGTQTLTAPAFWNATLCRYASSYNSSRLPGSGTKSTAILSRRRHRRRCRTLHTAVSTSKCRTPINTSLYRLILLPSCLSCGESFLDTANRMSQCSWSGAFIPQRPARHCRQRSYKKRRSATFATASKLSWVWLICTIQTSDRHNKRMKSSGLVSSCCRRPNCGWHRIRNISVCRADRFPYARSL